VSAHNIQSLDAIDEGDDTATILSQVGVSSTQIKI